MLKKEKVSAWKIELQKLSEMAKTKQNAAHNAFTFGLKHRLNGPMF